MLRQLRDRLNAGGLALDTLSMGMSHDLEDRHPRRGDDRAGGHGNIRRKTGHEDHISRRRQHGLRADRRTAQAGFRPAGLRVVEPLAENREPPALRLWRACSERTDAASLACDVLVLAVKPQQMREALAPRSQAGWPASWSSASPPARLADISRWLGGHRRLVRCMPNTPALIGAGITGLYADPSVDAQGADRPNESWRLSARRCGSPMKR
jgi:hypothetical protein